MNDETENLENGEDDAAAEDAWAAALAEQETEEATQAEAEVEPAELDEFTEGGFGTADESMEVILDIPVSISMEIGRTSISIRNLLQLNQGSVVELDRLAGEPMDVLVNGTLIAHGEVVVVNEKFGIRLTDVISAQERIKKLK